MVITVKLSRATCTVKLSLDSAFNQTLTFNGQFNTEDIVVRVIGTKCLLDFRALTPEAGQAFQQLWACC